MALKRSNVLLGDALVVMSLHTRTHVMTAFQLKTWAKSHNITLTMSQASNMLSRAKGLVVPTKKGWMLTMTGLAYHDMVSDTLRRLTERLSPL